MSDLIAICFDKKEKAEAALGRIAELQKQHLVSLADAVIVTRREDGKVKLHQSVNLVAAGAASGSFWGALIGLIFLNPLLGIAAGAGAGAIGGALSDIGINDDFMKKSGEQLQPNSSALFLLIREMTEDRVLPVLRELGGEVLMTNLSVEDENRLKDVLDQGIRNRFEQGEAMIDVRPESA